MLYLTHKTRNNAVKYGFLKSESLLAGTKLAEILGGFGDDVIAQLHFDPPSICLADFHVEITSHFCDMKIGIWT